jgi:hypothetical protein
LNVIYRLSYKELNINSTYIYLTTSVDKRYIFTDQCKEHHITVWEI